MEYLAFNILLDYVEGKLQEEEKIKVETYLKQHPLEKEAVDGIRLIYEQEHMNRSDLEKLIQELLPQKQSIQRSSAKNLLSLSWKRWTAVAATIVFIIGSVFLYQFFNGAVIVNDPVKLVNIAPRVYSGKALLVCERGNNENEEEMATLASRLNQIGNLQLYFGQQKKLEKRYKKALKIYKILSEQDPQYQDDFAATQANLAKLYLEQGKMEQVEQRYKKALKTLKQTELSPIQLVNAQMQLGNLYLQTNELEQAEQRYKKANKLLKKSDESIANQQYLNAKIQEHLGLVYFRRGNWEAALIRYKKSFQLFKIIDAKANLFQMAKLQEKMAEVFLAMDQPLQAELKYQKALKDYKRLSKQSQLSFYWEKARVLQHLGDLYFANEQHKEARQAYSRMLRILTKINQGYFFEDKTATQQPKLALQSSWNTLLQVFNEENPNTEDFKPLGTIFALQRMYDNAESFYKRYLKANNQAEHQGKEADANLLLAELYYSKNALEQAETYFRKALNIYQNIGKPLKAAESYIKLSRIKEDRKNFASTESLLQKANAIYQKEQKTQDGAKILVKLAEINAGKEDWELAADYYNQAVEQITLDSNPKLVIRILTGIGNIKTQLGECEEAFDYYNQADKLLQQQDDFYL